jgi:hypothetical protein
MSNRVKSLSEKFSELNILKLLVKDYHDFKAREMAKDPKKNEYLSLVYRAAQEGIGGFTSFVNAQTTGSDYLPGTLYDSNITEKMSPLDVQKYIAKWLQNN